LPKIFYSDGGLGLSSMGAKYRLGYEKVAVYLLTVSEMITQVHG